MEKNYIDGSTFADMIVSGAANLSSNKTAVNDLNVFPIPDGDTGDNMFMTIESGARMLRDSDSDSLSEASSVASRGMLLGARGNSGVILSRIFSGISKGLENKPSADVRVLHLAMERGIQESYSAVPVPVEGTILTVYRDAVKFAGDRIDENSTLDSYFRDFNTELRRSLEHTPEQLDVLKEAGVVDSGGAGLVYIFDGMLAALEGTGKQLAETATASSAPRIDLSLFTEDSELKFGYCTEFLLRLQHKKTDIDSFDIDEFIRGLSELGDSVVAFRDGSIVKVHVHSLTPGKVLDYGQRFGEFLTLKVENMTLQHSSKEHGEHNRDADEKKSKSTRRQ
ncbi:MAG: DAK2 domain-containing protein [Christensenellales bacterium]